MFKKKRHYPPKRPANYRPDFRRYETEKYQWIANHPNATGDEYVEFIRDLAQRCGI